MSGLNIYGVGESQENSDYIGFKFNNVHSSELGIKRVSDGSRFNENLLPIIQDKTVQVPGGDGTYYFGSHYTQRQFNISYAFDALTEEQIARIKALFGDKKVHELVFDEAPYKAYQVKVTGSASIKYIPFAEGETNRVYKGEGSIQFTAYNPYAYCAHKFLDDKYYEEYDNIEEWKDASNMLESSITPSTNIADYDVPNGDNKNTIKLYNPGVKESDFILSFSFSNGSIPATKIALTVNGTKKGELFFKSIESKKEDDQIVINTKLNLIEGYKNKKKSGNIYNEYITSGTFFKIPQSLDSVNLGEVKEIWLNIGDGTDYSSYSPSIEYNYYYF